MARREKTKNVKNKIVIRDIAAHMLADNYTVVTDAVLLLHRSDCLQEIKEKNNGR